MLKMGIITGFLSRTKDRFHDYNEPLELEKKFEIDDPYQRVRRRGDCLSV